MPEQNITDPEFLAKPRPEEPDVVTVASLAEIAVDPEGKKSPYPHFLARRFGELTGGVRVLRIASTKQEYHGLDGLIALIWDWVTSMRRAQTRKSRAASGGRPKQRAPSFFLKLSQADKIALREAFEDKNRKITVPALAAKYGTTSATLYRCARTLNWKTPAEFRQKA